MKFRDFHLNIKIRIVESFISRFVGSMIFPFMAIYLANHFGTKMAGVLLLVNVLVGIGVSFIGGYFSDQFGRRKIMLLAEVVRFSAFFTMMICNSPWIQAPFITFLMMTVHSVCWALAGPANQAMLIDVSTPDQRKLMYSIMYWANNLSIAVGGIIGAFLYQDHLFELFIGLSVVAGIVVLLVALFIQESYTPVTVRLKAAQHAGRIFTNYKRVLQDRLFVLFVVAGVLVMSMEFQLTNYIGIRLSEEFPSQRLLWWEIDGVKMMGFLRSENTILVALIALFAARVSGRLKDRSVLVTSCFLFTVGYGAISFSNNIWILFIMMIILTVGEVFRVPVEQSYMAAIPPDDARSSYMAFNNLKFNLGMLISSLTVTISAFLSTMLMALIITFVGFAGTLLYYLIAPKLDVRKGKAELKHVS
ncbi:MDR family MFS transporter [Sediminibacillus massiliensis]|uniref:MDR family MFS transporter n=1 Tax=Sediminibacillus massiliensis TaxID=1926277 RepID=UPI0009883104|nr:MFS transporter [Sediminibacillus massiliensis]